MDDIIVVNGEQYKELRAIAEEVICSYHTLLNWIKYNKIPKEKIRKIGNKWFLKCDRKDILEYRKLYYTRMKKEEFSSN